MNTDTLIFPDGATQRTNTNDMVGLQPWALQLNGLNYDISGNAVTLTTGISVNTPVGGFADLGPRFRPDITLAGTQTFYCETGKFLYIDGDVNLNGHQLGIAGACNTALRGAVFGSSDLKKLGSGSLYMQSGTYTYDGTTTIDAGTLYVGSSTLGTTGIGTTVNTGATLSLYLGVTLAEPVSVAGGTIENFLGDNTMTGNVTFGSNSTVDVLEKTLTIKGVVSGGFAKEGPGTLVVRNMSGAMVVGAGLVEATGNLGPIIVAAGGTLFASGALVYPLALNANGTFSPGTRATPGTISGTTVSWEPNGYMRARLGKLSDKLTLASSLSEVSTGYARFVFADGVTPPQPGVEYTLIEYPAIYGFDSGFSYTYEGTGPGASLTGSFNVTATKLTFTVLSVNSDLIFRSGAEP